MIHISKCLLSITDMCVFFSEISLLFDSVKKETKDVDLLVSLCNMYNTSEDELRKTLEQTNKIIADILKQKPCPASDCKSETLTMFDTG